ncbi:hypothetical protein DSO57_1008340 [Entomophthora muscae]|uniref:Uncharacterized protein n=1 Tax=Entomophthora muscae TaxID=34485 RepID=A0ACC2S929_9FUNG|nr:hypothetical protein DSO57_1008340 [Entomophthora muscae]
MVINPRVQKLTRKYTKVITTKTVNDITTKMVSYVYNPVYCRNSVPATIMEKVKPVLDTMYKPYVSDNKGQDDNKQPQYFKNTDEQKVLKKVAEFYRQVSMPCVVAEPVESLSNAKKAKHHIIPNSTRETFKRLMKETNAYKKAAAIIGILEKSAHRLHTAYLKMGYVLFLEKSKRKPILLVKKNMWEIWKWIKQNCHLELENIQLMVESTVKLLPPLALDRTISPQHTKKAA